MTTIATGGFSTADDSFAAFRSPMIEWIAIVFMILGALPFVLYIQATNGQVMALVRDAQVQWFLGITTVSALGIALWLIDSDDVPIVTAVRHATFATVALITGTGFASQDYGLWGPFPVALLFFLMCVGGCTGSTTGGIKIFRFTVLNAVARGQIARLIRPHGVVVSTFNGRPLPESAAIAVMGFIFMFALSFSVFAIALSALGLDYLTAMSGALTALANVGPGHGAVIGPSGNFASLPDSAKWLLSAAMLLGRLELFTVLVLFAPSFWRG
jgi:trk system potassium uptake protein TrkH